MDRAEGVFLEWVELANTAKRSGLIDDGAQSRITVLLIKNTLTSRKKGQNSGKDHQGTDKLAGCDGFLQEVFR